MNRRPILGVLALMAVAYVAAPTFGAIVTGSNGSGQPVTLPQAGDDAAWVLSFTTVNGDSGNITMITSGNQVNSATGTVTTVGDGILASGTYDVNLSPATSNLGGGGVGTFTSTNGRFWGNNVISPNQDLFVDYWGLVLDVVGTTSTEINLFSENGQVYFYDGIAAGQCDGSALASDTLVDPPLSMMAVVRPVPEPMSMAIWSLLGAGTLIGTRVARRRRG